jgi:hypothetical protein
MDQSDFDKLLPISDSTDEYMKSVIKKIVDTAIENGHDMSDTCCEIPNAYSAFDPLCLEIAPYCKKCIFEIKIEFHTTKSGIRTHVDFATISKKCDRK